VQVLLRGVYTELVEVLAMTCRRRSTRCGEGPPPSRPASRDEPPCLRTRRVSPFRGRQEGVALTPSVLIGRSKEVCKTVK
jgi:hypothetical protein